MDHFFCGVLSRRSGKHNTRFIIFLVFLILWKISKLAEEGNVFGEIELLCVCDRKQRGP